MKKCDKLRTYFPLKKKIYDRAIRKLALHFMLQSKASVLNYERKPFS